ncbi:MAG: response regulator [Gammaproteobacteria bacterium]
MEITYTNDTLNNPLSIFKHELRTPLTTIFGMVNFLKKEPLTPDQKKHVEWISLAASQLLCLENVVSALFKQAGDHTSKKSPAPPANPTDSDQKTIPCVLLVEDNELIQIIHRKMLESMGFTVHIACNGQEAISFSENLYALILMDIGLPDITGIEATAEIRRRESGKRVPILALTTHDQSSIHDKAISAGMDRVIQKPITQENLKKIIFEYI